MKSQIEVRTRGRGKGKSSASFHSALPSESCDKKMITLSSMNRDDLVAEWKAVFGHPAPRSAQVTLLRGALAARYQQDADPSAVQKQLSRQIRYWTAHAPVMSLLPGTKLFREWKGEVHEVIVLEHGFEYGGKTYRSLTAITRQITQLGWSGPLFFGLRK